MFSHRVSVLSAMVSTSPPTTCGGRQAMCTCPYTRHRLSHGGSEDHRGEAASQPRRQVETQGTGSVFATTAVEHTRQRHCFNHDGSGARKAKAVNQPRRQWKHKAKAAAYDEFEGVGPARRVLEPGLRVLGRAETVCTWRCSLVLENVLCVVTPKKERVTA